MGMADRLTKVFPDNEFLMNWEVIERAKRDEILCTNEEIEIHVLVPTSHFADFESWIKVNKIKNIVTKLTDPFLGEFWHTVSLFLNDGNLGKLMELDSDIYAFEEADELSPANN